MKLATTWKILYLLGLGLLLLPAVARAQFTFTTNNGTIQITRYYGTNDAVVVPSFINGLPVTSIAQFTFTCCNMTSVSLPESITNIGDAAFESSSYLTNLTIPSAIAHLGNGVFNECWSLTGISFPTNLMTIGDQAFQDCKSLSGLTLPATVTSIGTGAFFKSGLTNMVVGATLTNIGDYAFMGCAKLTNLVVNGQNPAYSSSGGVLFNKDKTVLCQYAAAPGSNSYLLPNGVTNIWNYAFYSCTNLNIVHISDTVACIGSHAFNGCMLLTNINLGSNVSSIGTGAFQSSGLRSITLPSRLTMIADYLCYGCGNLTNVTIPAGVTNIGRSAFYQAGIANIAIPGSVATLGDYAFFSCPNLQTIQLGDGIQRISQFAFSSCYDVVSINIPNSVGSIGYGAFYYCTSLGFGPVTIGKGVTNIEQNAFGCCPFLRNVFFLGNAPAASGAFINDTVLRFYYLPGGKGWENGLEGIPATLWNPQIIFADGNFGVRGDQFGFNITGTTNIPIVVEPTTNLNGPGVTLQPPTLTGGPFYFSDPQKTIYPRRFYRIRSP